jgi:hypothetical protein
MVGADPFGPVIDQAAAREQIGRSPIVVRRLPSATEAATCHVAFVHGATPGETAGMLLALRDQPVLTVTDGRFGPQRGIVHFTISQGRVRFFIDDAAAARSGLSISSRLLALALGVRQRRG